jgi:DUF4097 and DUF4098 domain-containing protein YvlB
MRSRYRFLLVGLAVIAVLSGTVIADERVETFRFEDIHSLDIKTISGSIRICPGDKSWLVVELINDLDEPDLLEPELEASRGRLFIEEHFTGRHVRGETHWMVCVPKDVSLRSVDCSNASGEISLEGFSANLIETESASGRTSVNSVKAKELDVSTASGSIIIEDCEADVIQAESASGRITANSIQAEEVDLSTASGRIGVKGCEADFIKANSASGRISFDSFAGKELDLSNASGRIIVEDAGIDESARMSSASGDVELYLSHLPSRHLEASSASGDVVLKVPQFGENFSMTLTKRADRGKVKCPFEYTETETIRLHKHDRYLTDRYVIERGKGGPDIELSTASGTVQIETDTKGR